MFQNMSHDSKDSLKQEWKTPKDILQLAEDDGVRPLAQRER